jgi:hypothetical protein
LSNFWGKSALTQNSKMADLEEKLKAEAELAA